MNRFDYVRPLTIAEAVAAGAAPGAAFLAAGTNLLDLMKGGISRPAQLVDISRLPGLDQIEYLDDGSVRIGALVRNADLAHDPVFARRYPAVAEALPVGCLGAVAERCHGRRQFAATHPLRLFLRRRQRVQQTRARRRLRCNRRRKPAACHTRMERALYRHPSLGFLRPAHRIGRVRGDRGYCGAADRAAGNLPLPARQHAGAGQRARTRRADHRGVPPRGCRRFRRECPLFEDSRTDLLRIRRRLCRCRAAAGGRHDRSSQACPWRRGR